MPQTVATRAAAGASAAAAALLGSVYLNNRYGVSTDIKQLLRDRAFRKRLTARVAQFSSNASLYHMLELADPSASALWFEGRSWSYAEVILGRSKRQSASMEMHD